MSKEKVRHQNFETGAVILVLSTVFVKIIGAIFKIPLSNLLGDEGFGCFASAYDLFTPFYVLSMSGFPIASSKIISEYYALGHHSEIRRYNIYAKRLFSILGVIFTAVFMLAIPLISSFVASTQQVKYSLLAVAPSILLFCIISAYRGYFEGIHNMTPTAVSEFIEAIGKLVLGYGGAYITLKVTHNYAYAAAAALFGITIGVAVATVFLAVLYRNNIKNIIVTGESEISFDVKATRKNILSLVISVAITSLLISVSSALIDSLTVQPCLRFANSTVEPIALYGIKSKAYTLYNLIPSLVTVIGVSAIPSIAQLFAQNNSKELNKRIISLIKLSAFLCVPAGLGFCALAKPIMNLLYQGENSVEIGSKLLFFYGISAVFTGITIPVIYALQTIGKHKNAVGILSIGVSIKIILNIVLVCNEKTGIMGAAVSTMCMFAFTTVAGMFLLFKSVELKGVLLPLFKIFTASSVCIVSHYLSHIFDSNISVIIIIAATAVLYFIFAFALKLFNKEEVKDFPGGNKILYLLNKH